MQKASYFRSNKIPLATCELFPKQAFSLVLGCERILCLWVGNPIAKFLLILHLILDFELHLKIVPVSVNGPTTSRIIRCPNAAFTSCMRQSAGDNEIVWSLPAIGVAEQNLEVSCNSPCSFCPSKPCRILSTCYTPNIQELRRKQLLKDKVQA